MASELSDKQRQSLKTYAKWRPRISQGATWATTTGALASLGSERSKKRALPLAAISGTAGVADHMLGEAAKKNKSIGEAMKQQSNKQANVRGGLKFPGETDEPKPPGTQDLNMMTDGMADRAGETYNGIIGVLFSQKARNSALSEKQLGSLFPQTSKDGYGRTVTIGRSAAEASKLLSQTFRRHE